MKDKFNLKDIFFELAGTLFWKKKIFPFFNKNGFKFGITKRW